MAKRTKHPAIVQSLLNLYAHGQFPMGEAGRPEIYVYQPDPRGILPLDGSFRVPGTLAARVRSGRFRITSNTAFEAVIRACARVRPGKEGGETTWITDDLVGMYAALHEHGHAHSVEAWLPGDGGAPMLVGGLYGVHLHGLFAGESMFSRPELGGTDASKVCLVHLVRHLRCRGFTLLDTQFVTPHLAQFGAREVDDAQYQRLLAAAMKVETAWEPFDAAAS